MASDVLLTVAEAAELADIKPAQLKLWLAAGKFETSVRVKHNHGLVQYYFSENDIPRLMKFAESQGVRTSDPPEKADPFIDDGTQSDFTVAQIASMWQLSTDTVQRMFADEPDVVVLGNKNPRGKRKRITLRIPRAVMERVKRRRSNT